MSRTVDMTTTPRPVNPTEPVALSIPPGAQIIHATSGTGGGGMGGMGGGPEVVVWYDYDAEATYEGQEDQYMVVPTGYVLPDGYSHVATVLFGSPSNAVHLYKAKADAPVEIEPETPVIVEDETPADTDPEVGTETEVPVPDLPVDDGTEPDAEPDPEPVNPSETEEIEVPKDTDSSNSTAEGVSDPTAGNEDTESTPAPAVPSQPPATTTPEA